MKEVEIDANSTKKVEDNPKEEDVSPDTEKTIEKKEEVKSNSSGTKIDNVDKGGIRVPIETVKAVTDVLTEQTQQTDDIGNLSAQQVRNGILFMEYEDYKYTIANPSKVELVDKIPTIFKLSSMNAEMTPLDDVIARYRLEDQNGKGFVVDYLKESLVFGQNCLVIENKLAISGWGTVPLYELKPVSDSYARHPAKIVNNAFRTSDMIDFINMSLDVFLRIATLPNILVKQPRKYTMHQVVQNMAAQHIIPTSSRLHDGMQPHILWNLITTQYDWYREVLERTFAKYPVRLSENGQTPNTNSEKIAANISVIVDQAAAYLIEQMFQWYMSKQMIVDNYVERLRAFCFLKEQITPEISNMNAYIQTIEPREHDHNNYMLMMFIDQKFRRSQYKFYIDLFNKMNISHQIDPSYALQRLRDNHTSPVGDVSKILNSILATKVNIVELSWISANIPFYDIDYITDDITEPVDAYVKLLSLLYLAAFFPKIYLASRNNFCYQIMLLLEIIHAPDVNAYIRNHGWVLYYDDANREVIKSRRLIPITHVESRTGHTNSLLTRRAGGAGVFTDIRNFLNGLTLNVAQLRRRRRAQFPTMLNDYQGASGHEDRLELDPSNYEGRIQQQINDIDNISNRLVNMIRGTGALVKLRTTLEVRELKLLESLIGDANRTAGILGDGTLGPLEFMMLHTPPAIDGPLAMTDNYVFMNKRFTTKNVPHTRHGFNIVNEKVELSVNLGMAILLLSQGRHNRRLYRTEKTKIDDTSETSINSFDMMTAEQNYRDAAAFSTINVNAHAILNEINAASTGTSILHGQRKILDQINTVATINAILTKIQELTGSNVHDILGRLYQDAQSDMRYVDPVVMVENAQGDVRLPEQPQNTKYGTKFYQPDDIAFQKMRIAATIALNYNSPIWYRTTGARVGLENVESINPYNHRALATRFLWDQPVVLTNENFQVRDNAHVLRFNHRGEQYLVTDPTIDAIRGFVFEFPSLMFIPLTHQFLFKEAVIRGHIGLIVKDITLAFSIDRVLDRTKTTFDITHFISQLDDLFNVPAKSDFPITLTDTTQAHRGMLNQAVRGYWTRGIGPNMNLTDPAILKGIHGELNSPPEFVVPDPDNWCYGHKRGDKLYYPSNEKIPKLSMTKINYNNDISVVNKLVPDLPKVNISGPRLMIATPSLLLNQ